MPDTLIALLRWYSDMGVDIALDGTPHDRLAPVAPQSAASNSDRSAPERLAPPPEPIAPLSRPASALAPLETLERDAREAAAGARTLEELREELLRFNGCGLKTTATQLVFGDGEAGAEIMFVGEAPGADEDRQGIPFVGRAGQLLNRMMASIGLQRSEVYISNVVPWRPPGNRTPSPLETAACLPFTQRQIELVRPKLLVSLGLPSAQTLLGAKDTMSRTRGRWFVYRAAGLEIPALAMFHPAYLLRAPAQKKVAWGDLRLLARALAKQRGAQD